MDTSTIPYIFNCLYVWLCPGEIHSSENTYFCQAAQQLSNVPSSQLCVKLASGGDPTYAFNIRFTGEEVHGTSQNSTILQLSGIPNSLNKN